MCNAMAYTGVNVLLLWHAAQERGFARNEWMTFNQARDIGAKVRKGSKGTMCIVFSMIERAAKNDIKGGSDGDDMVPMIKPFWLFNVADIDGLVERSDSFLDEFQSVEEGEFILKSSGAHIEHGGNRAFYAQTADLIHLPQPQQFKRPADYCATALHELIHWTGHESRLSRNFSKRFGDEAYAFEELVAELGSAFVLAELNLVDHTIEDHARYMQSWLKVLKNDKTAIFTAAKHASAAHALVMSHCNEIAA